MRTLVEMVGARFTEKELDAAMAELDPSGDGQVQFSEFKQYWVRRLPPPPPPSTNAAPPSLAGRLSVRGPDPSVRSGAHRTRTLSRAAAC